MIGQTFTLIGSPKLVFRLVWRGSIAGIDCVRGVALNGKFQTLKRAADVVFVRGRLVDPAIEKAIRQPSRDPPCLDCNQMKCAQPWSAFLVSYQDWRGEQR
jgi:hypothetical protein